MILTYHHVYQVHPRKDKRGVDLISDVLPFVSSGMVSRKQSAAQSDTRCTTAVHTML
jgi:hypothetical protein